MSDITNGEGHGKKSSQVSIDMVQMGPDWVYFEAGQGQPAIPELPLFLNQALVGWLREHPHYRVRATQGVVQAGTMLGLHAWYDVTNSAQG